MILETVEEEAYPSNPDRVTQNFNEYLNKMPDISYKELPPNPKVQENMKFLNNFRSYSRSSK